MTQPSITHKVCTRCKHVKSVVEFHRSIKNPSGYKSQCKDCRKKTEPYRCNRNPYIETTCRSCGKQQQRRKDAVKIWSGLCKPCSPKERKLTPEIKAQMVANRMQTIANWSPERKAQRAELSRQQVLRQGGVPNASKFVKEGESGRRMAGENHYAWKGGTPQSEKIRGCYRYSEWRKAVFKRDDYTCQFCKKRGGKLEADHILPYSTHVELRYEVSNGRTLCRPCHRKTDTYGGRMFTYAKMLNDIKG